MKYYVAVDVGCIECGEDSAVLGIFSDKDLADQVIEDHAERQKKDWHGQHSFEIFEVDGIDNKIVVDYQRHWD